MLPVQFFVIALTGSLLFHGGEGTRLLRGHRGEKALGFAFSSPRSSTFLPRSREQFSPFSTSSWNICPTGTMRHPHPLSMALETAAAETPTLAEEAPQQGIQVDLEDLTQGSSLKALHRRWLHTPLPEHPGLRRGRCANGLEYLILPNKHPAGRFEAHMEVHAGSVDELDDQQGMAHMCEHISYMGSAKRSSILSKSVQTNAYTDFHHTVFFAKCPVLDPTSRGSPVYMLPRALEALLDVLEAPTQFNPSRLEHERKAVLSEASMVNTVDYREECQTLMGLHNENRLAIRFPLGELDQIRNWNLEDVKKFHSTHYRPENAFLYVVGDLDAVETERQIQQVFERLKKDPPASYYDNFQKMYLGTMKDESIFLPAIKHSYHSNADGQTVDDENLRESLPAAAEPKQEANVTIFQSDVVHSLSLSVMIKRPLEGVRTVEDVRRSVLRMLCLKGLHQRLNIFQRGNGLFRNVELTSLDSVREAAHVVTLDITTDEDPLVWKEAVSLAFEEVKKLGEYGLMENELPQLIDAFRTDMLRTNTDGRVDHHEWAKQLMDQLGRRSTILHPEQEKQITLMVLEDVTLEDVNGEAKNLCNWLTDLGKESAPQANGVVVCTPETIEVQMGIGGGDSKRTVQRLELSSPEVMQVIREAAQQKVDPVVTSAILPDQLLSVEEVSSLSKRHTPRWTTLDLPKEDAENIQPYLSENGTLFEDRSLGLRMRQLDNGVKINFRPTDEGAQAYVRILIPGGRMAEVEGDMKAGALALGAKTLMEGGAFGSHTREQIELFCNKHLLAVNIQCETDTVALDFAVPTIIDEQTGEASEDPRQYGNTEAVFQIIRSILAAGTERDDPLTIQFQEDAFRRAQASFATESSRLRRDLLQKGMIDLIGAMSGEDSRFVALDENIPKQVTLEEAKEAMASQLDTRNIEVSIFGQYSVPVVEAIAKFYLGTITPSSGPSPADLRTRDPEKFWNFPERHTLPEHTEVEGRTVRTRVRDSDERVIVQLSGLAPNRWGYLADGTHISERMGAGSTLEKVSSFIGSGVKNLFGGKGKEQEGKEKDGTTESASASLAERLKDPRVRRSHPAFARIAIEMARDLLGKRTFSVMREEQHLTYDASFDLNEPTEVAWGRPFFLTVYTNPQQADLCTQTAKKVLADILDGRRPAGASLETARRSFIQKTEADLMDGEFFIREVPGLQLSEMQMKNIAALRGWREVAEAITLDDIQEVIELFGIHPDEIWENVAVSGRLPGEETRGGGAGAAGSSSGAVGETGEDAEGGEGGEAGQAQAPVVGMPRRRRGSTVMSDHMDEIEDAGDLQ
uniref:Peptidase M16 N-terminal domain-containing protein n=1 Tax=Chromera velia CCMP2878 TaxID=1169474 RepID=A0A0G4HE29_9ALVE|eukprot:Cvel_6502.t1-p1 / transcript=Cvel_6502.t1 / gene=Cvel_6502 / organism=Chromera_velia_CCMP2878 / gene_product=Probable zinc protease PqqL, putative / transcript_product=Probable zinc protease PqqL, putative / location=Cvel_scaffold319:25511-42578(+) / protein_length=1310 / sequence_SO=supercontig / SO=protein_coding / is_pseudo=false